MADEDDAERRELSEPQFKRSMREASAAERNIQEASERAAEARAVKRAIYKRLEGYGAKRRTLKLLEQFIKIPEDEREQVVGQLSRFLEWSRYSSLLGDNRGPRLGEGDGSPLADAVRKLPKPLRGPGRPRRGDDDRPAA